MTDPTPPDTEAERLENLWAGDFGVIYTRRNEREWRERSSFWKGFLERYPLQRILEVGCNSGMNLEWILQAVPAREVYGVDINEPALVSLRKRFPQANALWSPARELPFRDGWFDLVFCAGVLIHQPETSLRTVMKEIVRCSRRYVLCMEYFSEETVAIPYRGQEGALFKRNYGRLYQEDFPALRLLEQGFLSREQGWDNVTFWMFEKT